MGLSWLASVKGTAQKKVSWPSHATWCGLSVQWPAKYHCMDAVQKASYKVSSQYLFAVKIMASLQEGKKFTKRFLCFDACETLSQTHISTILYLV